jgi:hypothetical protein
MLRKKFEVQRVRVASPCSVAWESMTGNSRVRHCGSCDLNVYNTAGMTSREIETLVRKSEGRVCIRLHRRADGTVLTKNCPTGLNAMRRRAVRLGSACLSMIFGLMSLTYAQKNDPLTSTDTAISGEAVADPQRAPGVFGTIADRNGAVIPSAQVSLFLADNTKKETRPKPVNHMTSRSNGEFIFTSVAPGTYRLEVSAPNFTKSIVKGIIVTAGKALELNVEMEVAGTSVEVGIYAETEPLIDVRSSDVTTTIKGRKLIVW